MKTRWFLILILITMAFFPLSVTGELPPSPEEVFGFRMGTDRKLIDWEQIVTYFMMLDQSSDRIIVQELGKTTLDKPFLLATISSPENLQNLDRYKAIQQKLANPYDLQQYQAEALVKEGKIIVLISLNIHSTEIGSSQESVELAYELISSPDSKIEEILDSVIILLIPSLNPDGQQMVVDWYREHLGTPNEGCPLPQLYHPYAGHDNNRDWFMFNLQESKLVAKVLYHEWFPEIVYDQHQTGSSRARLFVPPYSDPINPNVHPTLLAEVNMIGKHVVADMHEKNYKGIVTGYRYNSYFEGTMSKTPLWHNMVGILSELASVRVATPVYLPRGSLGQFGPELPIYSKVSDFLDPWEGGWWRLRDIIEYEKEVTYSILDLAAKYKNKFMMNYYNLNVESIQKGQKQPPFAYIIPLDQHDPNSASEMLKRLQMGGVRIFRSQSDFIYKGISYPWETYLIPLAQPSRPYIKDLMEPQKYPNLKLYPKGPPKPPYDVTGWTLPLQMGVTVQEVTTPLEINLVPVETFDFETIDIDTVPAKYYLIERRYNHTYAIVNEIFKAGAKVYQAEQSFSTEDTHYPLGTIIIPNKKGINTLLQSLSQKYKVPIYGVNDIGSVEGSKLFQPRLGIYQSWIANSDEGWTRLVLDNHHFSYDILHNKDIKKGRLRPYHVIIIPDMSVSVIVDGKRKKEEEPLIGTAELPEQYQGGIDKEGIEALRDFIDKGGTLITFGEASEIAINKLHVPAVNVLDKLSEKEFYAPGSILKIELDTTHPIAFGMPKQVAIRMTNSPTFRLLPYIRESKAIGYYGDEDPLLSGWLIGAEKLAGMTALTEIPVEQGRVILFGFRVQSRSQTFGTFKLLFNAILTSRSEPINSFEAIGK